MTYKMFDELIPAETLERLKENYRKNLARERERLASITKGA